jgi:hypothetical protein
MGKRSNIVEIRNSREEGVEDLVRENAGVELYVRGGMVSARVIVSTASRSTCDRARLLLFVLSSSWLVLLAVCVSAHD